MTAPKPEQLLKELRFQLTVTRAMLGTLELDQVLFIILSGITHGGGLNFNRAFLFLADEAGRELRASTAVGPTSKEEAHRIWEAMEEQNLDLNQLLSRYEDGGAAGLHGLSKQLLGFSVPMNATAPPHGDEDDVPIHALVARSAQQKESFFSNELKAIYQPPTTAGGESLQFSHLAVVPLLRDETVLGVILVDNHYNKRAIEKEEMRGLHTLGNMAAIAIEKARLHQRLKEMAALDGLTGVFNRRHYEMRLEQEIARAKRAGRSLSLAFFDIDHFKACNDNHGHECGDKVLKDLAGVLERRVRAEDLVARYGGEEFVVLLTGGATEEEAAKVTEKLRAEVESMAMGDRPAGEITVSGGVATLQASELEAGQLFRLADKALYKAKQGGRNRVEVATT